MSKKNRKSGGQKPKKSSFFQSKNSEKSRKRPFGGKDPSDSGGDSRPKGAFFKRDNTPEDEAKGRRSGSRSEGKSRRPIKNARGLGDVIGQAGAGRRAGGDRGGYSRPQPKGAPSRDQSKHGVSSKLTYIMSFQPPGDARHEPMSGGPTIPEKVSVIEPTAPSRPGDFRWPKERVKPGLDVRGTAAGAPRGEGIRQKDASMVVGIVKRHPDGFGFLIPDNSSHPDVYISRHSMVGVMTNDRVEVAVFKPKSRNGKKDMDRLAGEVVRILKRSNKRIVGKYLPVDQKYGVIQDENRGWGCDLRIATADSMNAKEGDLVVVEVTQFPDGHREFTGRVVGLMGDLEDPLNDVMRIIHQAGIPTEFSATAIAEARKYGGVVTPAEAAGREDLTGLNLITIDGATAKDFDDAVYTEQTEDGFRLIVAIADVSHYVKPGTTLDHEAYERGTSTYFPNFVVPMLPEALSNELCSLNPHVKRLCFACEMRINFNGEVLDFRFFEGVMESKARVTYGEAQEVLESGTQPRLKDVADNIRRSADLAKILMQKRFREGSLDLEIPETQVVVDTSGESVDIIKSERLFAHRLIEELMLVSNICAARFLDQAEIPGVYRIHEEPDPDNIKALQRYLWNLGGNKSVMGGLLQKKLTKALQSMEGKPEAQILNILTLRTMKQAHYSADNVGHFGLGFSHYTHFTSPIRRYPDLIAHRLIKSQLYGKYRSMEMTEEELASATTMLSACEQRSVKAERQVISIKKARFIRRFVGQEFDGIISSVTKFGCFVLLRQYDVDGLVKIEDLGPDRFMFDDENLRLIGARSGLRYSIGDAIRVRVRGADPEQGKVDFELAIDFDADLSIDEDFAADDELAGEARTDERRRGDRRQSDRRKEGRKDFSGKAPRRAASGRSDRRGEDRKEKGQSSAGKRSKAPGRRRQKKSR